MSRKCIQKLFAGSCFYQFIFPKCVLAMKLEFKVKIHKFVVITIEFLTTRKTDLKNQKVYDFVFMNQS